MDIPKYFSYVRFIQGIGIKLKTISKYTKFSIPLKKRFNFAETDACLPNPCQHGGTCRDENGTAKCECKGAWAPPLCKGKGTRIWTFFFIWGATFCNQSFVVLSTRERFFLKTLVWARVCSLMKILAKEKSNFGNSCKETLNLVTLV